MPCPVRAQTPRSAKLPGRLRKASAQKELWTLYAAARALSGRPVQLTGKNVSRPSPDAVLLSIQQPDSACYYHMSLEALSDEARYVVLILLDTPAELIEFFLANHWRSLTKQNIERYLRRVLEWDYQTVELAMDGAKDFLREMSK